jgi:uncharacterized membrane protein YeaQ/YmgE (transglycosylase-associated protein family)
MEFLWMVLIGLVAGALAKFFMPGDDPGGILMTIVIGIAGAVIAGWLGRATLGWYGPGEAGPGLIASIVGAMLLLGIYRVVAGRRPRHPGAV